ncbi:MAG: DNA-directed RNA polymerase subunit beta [Desulfohalobiaceae bacterium]|nr:DNA-directed RNA polymerase subunit beta [Desulfohalobiaceae bacterium]
MTQLVKKFGKIQEVLKKPHLLDLQRNSYRDFLQLDVPPDSREEKGLEGTFRSVFPIEDFYKSSTLEYVNYEIGEPKYDVQECITKGLTYEAPLRITVRLIVYDMDTETEKTHVRDMKEQKIYFGTIPLMTDKATFIVNGTERVVVNQLQRSPGILFDHDSGKSHVSRKVLYSARVIPMRGSWLDFDFDHKDLLYVRIDRRRKMPVTVLLKAMDLSEDKILNYFYDTETYSIQDGRFFLGINPDLFRREKVYSDVLDKDGKVLIKAGKEISRPDWKKITRNGVNWIEVDRSALEQEFLAEDVVDPETGEVLARLGQRITPELIDLLEKETDRRVSVYHTKGLEVSASLLETLELDKTEDTQSAQIEIYRRLRPSSPPTPEVAQSFFENIFRNPEYYDLSVVGRYKLNKRLELDQPSDVRTLTNEDILRTIKKLIQIKEAHGPADDIDHLGNRRVRPVGELVENQYRIGLVRMERAIKERMTQQDVATLMPHDLINPKPVTAAVKEFFGTSQLSQFMDQTNPLSEVTHKRRLSALGPGGLTRERAGFEVRDVHPSHYGRICPIETPEGPNIGLIVSLTTYAQVNEYGFVETPYRKAENARATKEIVYMDAAAEYDEIIAQANAPLDEEGYFVNEQVMAREKGEFSLVSRDRVTYMDIAPSQIVSVSSSLIPFLEHDDANRALMGSNMQRQAVPLLRNDPPVVGTDMEGLVARNSGNCLLAEGPGVVDFVDSTRIAVRYKDPHLYPQSGGVVIYDLQKYHKSNQNSSFTQRPTAKPGQAVEQGEILADGPSTHEGELALGKNLLAAFMPWGGYNFEDAILVSERCVKDDVFTSVHIEEFEALARDTKLGPEEITRDIPNVSEDMLRNLDESGVIRTGAKIKPDDILVGKITPKGETQLTPEERLLRAIFGDKARDVKNTSLKVPPGIEGTVLDVKVFNRRSTEKDERTKQIEDQELELLDQKEQMSIDGLVKSTQEQVWSVVQGKNLVKSLKAKDKGKVLAEANKPLQWETLSQVPLKRLQDAFTNKETNAQVKEILDRYEEQLEFIRSVHQKKRDKVTEGDDLPPGVIKMVKVYVAIKRKLGVGDKMAGRHGNKGVISCILPEEDMPFFQDGTPVDIVLNPLGVPSRMNIGQIMENHLGYAAKELGSQLAAMSESNVPAQSLRKEIKEVFKAPEVEDLVDSLEDQELLEEVKKLRHGIRTKTPVFDGASEQEIEEWLQKAGLAQDAKAELYDGRTGEQFHYRVAVGSMYMLKLHHLVDEKIHARSTGPYSLVTQQPLGGKAQFGGQRLGEMEVWALEAYGAAYLLQEFLTVKSDDVQGRIKMYENIVKGENYLTSAMPESFSVLIKELMALGLDVSLIQEDE